MHVCAWPVNRFKPGQDEYWYFTSDHFHSYHSSNNEVKQNHKKSYRAAWMFQYGPPHLPGKTYLYKTAGSIQTYIGWWRVFGGYVTRKKWQKINRGDIHLICWHQNAQNEFHAESVNIVTSSPPRSILWLLKDVVGSEKTYIGRPGLIHITNWSFHH